VDVDLGAQLTISARGAYAIEEDAGNVRKSWGSMNRNVGLYGRLRELRYGGVWTLDSFLDGLLQGAKHCVIEGDLGWAVKTSLSTMDAEASSRKVGLSATTQNFPKTPF
jgi:hypothetical protein